MSANRVCRRFFVTGKVQGVFFRASTAREALQLGLRGWAVNLPDGRVEVLALGSPESVARLAGWLERGPPMARVDEVAVIEEPVAGFEHVGDFRTG